MDPSQMMPEDVEPEIEGRQLSTAPDASFETGAGADDTGFDSPPYESSQLGNTEVAETEHAEPVFPPDMPKDGGKKA